MSDFLTDRGNSWNAPPGELIYDDERQGGEVRDFHRLCIRCGAEFRPLATGDRTCYACLRAIVEQNDAIYTTAIKQWFQRTETR